MKVLSIQTVSNKDAEMNRYIKQYVSGALKLRYTVDTYGNIYVSKGEKNFVGIVCHTDTVHEIVPEYELINHKDEVIYAFGRKTETGMYGMVGCGGDDKVGVYICLQALKDLPDVKCVFYRNEEIGHLGSKNSDVNYLKDCSFIIECDRRNGEDFITNSGGIQIASEQFETECKPIYTKHGYQPALGIGTDVNTLTVLGVGVSCVNLSCGYYLPHTDSTFVLVRHVNDCYKLVVDMYNNLRYKKYKHQYIEPKQTYYGCDNHELDFDKTSKIHKTKVVEEYSLIEVEPTLTLLDYLPSQLEFIKLLNLETNTYDYFKPSSDFSSFRRKSSNVDSNEPNMLKRINMQYRLTLYEDEELDYSCSCKKPVYYVYSRLHKAWILEEEAIWDATISTYTLNK